MRLADQSPPRRYLLDTNALSSLISDPVGVVGQRVRAIEQARLCTSIVVSCELRYGARKRGSETLTRRVEQLLGALSVLPLAADADRHYARVRHELERAGGPIGANDLLIAAHALAEGCILVSTNQREFSRVRGLVIEDWSR